MKLLVTCPPSLHDKRPELREAFRAQLRATISGKYPRRAYRVSFCLFGNWFDAAGNPNSRDTDNVLKVLFDELAAAMGLGTNGKGDQYLNRHYSVHAIQHGREFIEITLE